LFQRRPGGGRGVVRRRPTFHIWPQASHRQYVEASTFSLGVEIFADWQNGQALGAAGSVAPGISSSCRDTDTSLNRR
jgi:hypothetical protein